jgi:hypothetical protein
MKDRRGGHFVDLKHRQISEGRQYQCRLRSQSHRKPRIKNQVVIISSPTSLVLLDGHAPSGYFWEIYHHSGYCACRGKSSCTRTHDARDSQKMCALGWSTGALSRDPAGMTTVLPLRESRGKGQPQVLQNHLAKLCAVARSKRSTESRPESHVSWCGST